MDSEVNLHAPLVITEDDEGVQRAFLMNHCFQTTVRDLLAIREAYNSIDLSKYADDVRALEIFIEELAEAVVEGDTTLPSDNWRSAILQAIHHFRNPHLNTNSGTSPVEAAFKWWKLSPDAVGED